MHTKHIDKLIEAYLDNQLSLESHQYVDIHIKECPTCARRLFSARRLRRELGTTLQITLGHPTPPPMLRQKVAEALAERNARRPFYFRGVSPIPILNGVGNVALIGLLVFGVFFVIQGRIPWLPWSSSASSPLALETDSQDSLPLQTGSTAVGAIPSFSTLSVSDNIDAQPFPGTSLGDTVELGPSEKPPNMVEAPPFPLRGENSKEPQGLSSQIVAAPFGEDTQTGDFEPSMPAGTIAYALFDPTAGLEHYRIHLISPDGSNLRQYPLEDVSEPALYSGSDNYTVAFRSWAEPDNPRRLLTSDMEANQPEVVGHFWEDAQPDWSPVENRIIFASQRESDRRWRLYTAWGDGSLEVNLRREGRSPTFAPDGYRFAFESCDKTGQQCGLWIGDIDHSELDSALFLNDPMAKSPDWSPKNEKIVYMSDVGGNWDLFLVDSSGLGRRRLTDDPARDGLPVWSPDGEWLAFVSDRDGEWGLWLLHVDSHTLHRTITFQNGSLAPSNAFLRYSEHAQRHWWDEQLSWVP